MRYTVLLVENDKKILETNKKLLEKPGGYTVRLARNIAEAWEQIEKEAPNLIVVDIVLPDGNGLEFIRKLRMEKYDIPVLLLSVHEKSRDIVSSMKAGADDCLSRPYDNDVFLARLEALLRRSERVPKTITKGPLVFDIISGRVFLGGHDLLLTQKEFACLLFFTQNEGVVMSAQSVYENVWKLPLGNNINTLQATISNLRKKIEPSGWEITVLRNQGYIFGRFERKTIPEP